MDSTTANQAVEAVRALTHELPTNDFGLPIGIYRVDLLPFHDYVPPNAATLALPSPSEAGNGSELLRQTEDHPCEAQATGTNQPQESSDPDPIPDTNGKGPYRIAGFLAKDLNQAFVPIQYDEGFPAFADGRPFWNRLDFEPQDVFYAFDQYLRMPLGRPSSFDEGGEIDNYGKEASGTRSLSALVDQLYPNLTGNELLGKIDQYRESFYLYYWGMRAHAYDLFRVAQHQKQQELRALETQDEHYIDARKIRARLMQYMGSEEEFWDLMTPKVGVDLLKQVAQLERISAGIPAAGPPGQKEDGDKHRSFELAFRTIAQTARPTVRASNEEGDAEVLTRALEDPDATEVLQELIIRQGG
jgi:hypothetical protein